MAPTAEADLRSAPPDIRNMLSPGAEGGAFEDLLERPTKIYTATWSAGAFTTVNIDPWVLFLNDPMVQSVVYRYRALRGDLSLRVQINGTPFHYGLLVAAYHPGIEKSRKVEALAPVSEFQLTTCPHVLVNPATSNVGKFTCPMSTPYNYLDLTSQTPSCGTLTLASLVDLASASGTVDAITVNVYAHMEDPKLSLPIVRNTTRTYIAQMGRRKNRSRDTGSNEKEEATTEGFISGPLSLASRWAGYFTEVPAIGPYATAASSFASHAADFAKFLGYSRPRDLEASRKISKLVGGNFANTDGVDTSSSLAIRQDQELTIDPRVFGVPDGYDELTVAAIAGKWSCVGETTWTVGSSPNTVLVSQDVTPSFGISQPLPGAQYALMTPLYFASIPFDYWTGTIEVKVQVVCSKYHRGRLRVQWAPDTTFDDDTSINTSFSHIIEISDQVDHVFQIPYALPTGYTPVHRPGLVSGAPNGTFRVVVQNELTSPEATNSAHILLWVRAGSDFKLAKPGPGVSYLSVYAPQMGDVGITDTDVSEKVHTFFENSQFAEHNDVFIGDPVVSFRPLLKRYTHSVTLAPLHDATIGDDSAAYQEYYLPIYPQDSGNVPYSSGYAEVTIPGPATRYLNVVTTHLMSYLKIAFLGARGGARWKIATVDHPEIQMNSEVVLDNAASIGYSYQATGGFATNGLMNGDNAFLGSTAGYREVGTRAEQYQHGTTNGNKLFELEVPYYDQLKFCTDYMAYFTGEGVHPSIGLTVKQWFRNFSGAALDYRCTGIRCFAAASEDFTMGMWRGIIPPYLVDTKSTPGSLPTVDAYQ